MNKTDELQDLKKAYPDNAKASYDLYRRSRGLYERTQAALGRRPQVRTVSASTEGVQIKNG